MSGSNLSLTKFQQLLAVARAKAEARKEKESAAAISSLQSLTLHEKPTEVDLSALQITSNSLETPEGREQAIETIQEISASVSNISDAKIRTTGVAADVELNERQQKLVDTILSGDDCCLIGAAGTGKTTATGKAIKKLVESDRLAPTGADTKWLRKDVLGVVITSFTRKAVNNIRRAVPDELKPHVQTMHKLLEFSPEFYEIFDEKTNSIKKTMKFEPKRNALNPLPSGIKLCIFEESSMIGTDLYKLWSDAMPHNPQEVFIGDIRQLPPVFGPAILGFKMSLLPVVELTEVYRQALLSPIIRLAHGILSGDSSKFSVKVVEKEEAHPVTGRVMKRKYVPSYEAFEEEGEHGTVKIQPWQKKISSEDATHGFVNQVIHWIKTGYFNPADDIILCPFNKSFGTIEINKGIANYLGQQRGAVVHEVIAGFEKHYLAVGDRVLYDKEDAEIVEIKRNLNYMGKNFQHPHVMLDRWGALQQELSAEEQKQQEEEDNQADFEAVAAFMESMEDNEERVNAASHVVKIRFSYSEDELELTSAGEINNLLGGYAITVHKMQGSENEKVFLVLHHSHAAMVSNELLYTAVTRARSFLHIICEVDTFNKGVRSHKVRGRTLAEKIEFFKGKGEFLQMQKEMEFLQKQRALKEEQVDRRKLLREIDVPVSPLEESKYEPDIVDYTDLVPDTIWSDNAWIPEQEKELVAESRPLSALEKLSLLRNKLKEARK